MYFDLSKRNTLYARELNISVSSIVLLSHVSLSITTSGIFRLILH